MTRVRTGTYFVQGNEACAEGAIAAGCTFYAGYPITPSSEIAETMARRLPGVSGVFIQMEDEIGSMAAVCGASWSGRKSMTASSGPGFSLKQENLGWAIKNETPCVVALIQRAGPSGGVATKVGGQEFYQSRYGSQGDYGIIVLSPNSVQEMFDLTVEAFNLSEIYRVPVILLGDEIISHMRDKLVIPDAEELRVVERNFDAGEKEGYKTFGHMTEFTRTSIPMPKMGDGYGITVAPYTHNAQGHSSVSMTDQHNMVYRLTKKINENVEDITLLEMKYMDDAEYVVVSYGAPSRSALSAVKKARKNGVKVGYLRLISLWPFPDRVIYETARQVKKMLVVEMNVGQAVREVERASKANCEVEFLGKPGIEMHTPEEIEQAIERMVQA